MLDSPTALSLHSWDHREKRQGKNVLTGETERQRDHVLGAETAVSTRGVRKLAHLLQERLGSSASREPWRRGITRERPSGHLGSSEVTRDSELARLADQSVRIPCDEALSGWLAGADAGG